MPRKIADDDRVEARRIALDYAIKLAAGHGSADVLVAHASVIETWLLRGLEE